MGTRKLKARLEAEDRATPVFSRFGSQLKLLGGLAVTVGLVQLGRKLVQGFEAASEAAAKQERSDVAVSTAIRNIGRSVDETLPEIKAMASGLQDLTGIGDEVILQGQSLLITMGNLTGQGLERATQAALDLAAANERLSTDASFDLIAKAATGYTSTLSRYGIILDQTIPSQDKFAAALAFIEKRFGGSAQAQLDTFSGRVAEFQGRLGDLSEVIGGPINEAMEVFLRDLLSPTVDRLGDAASESDAYRDAVLKVGIAVAETVEVLASFLSLLGIAGKGFTNASITLLDTVPGFASVRDSFKQIGLALEIFSGIAAATGDQSGGALAFIALRAKEAADNLRNLLEQGPKLEDFGDDAASNFKFDIPESADPATIIEPFQEGLDEFNKALELIPRRVDPKVIVEPLELFTDELEEARKQSVMLNTSLSAMGNIVANAASRLGGTLVDAAFGAEVQWSKFFVNFLKQIAAAIVQAIILRAIMTGISGGASTVGGFGSFGFAQRGGIVPGVSTGTDPMLIRAEPGELVIPRELSQFLLRAASGQQQAGPTEIIVHTDVPSFVREINQRGQRRNVTLRSRATLTNRAVRKVS